MKNRQVAFLNETKRQNTKSVDYLDIGNGVFVIPYSFISGAVNLSEKGIETETGTYITNPASFLQLVFTGKDAINVCWDNSTYLTPNTTDTNKLDYNFQVGDYFYGKPISGQVEGGAEISQVEGNDDFLAMKTFQSITIQFEYEEPITGAFYEASVFYHHLVPNDLYKRKLYKIPQLGENKWFYISNSQPLFDDQTGKMIGSIVTFDTILDKLQSTGRAIEQYVQNGAPGEPRAVPQIEYNWGDGGIEGATLTLNENEKQLDPNRLIHYVQTELQGAGGYCGCMVYGRRLTENDGVITTEAWEMLLPHEFYQFNTNPLNKTSVPSSTYNFIPDYKLSMNITQDMLEAWKKVQDSLSTCQCAGKIYLGVTGDWSGELPTGTHKSNPNNLPYWDSAWLPLSVEGMTTRTSISMSGSPYTSVIAEFSAADNFKSLFIKNTFVCMNNPQLPVEIDFSKPYHLSNVPILGRLVTPWIGDRTLFANKTSIPQEGIGMFIDKSYLSQIIQLTPRTSGTTNAFAFLSSLGGEMVPKGFGATSYNTSMCWKLTDILGDGKQTILLGQKKYADGTYISEDHTPYTLDLESVVTTQDSHTGYIIDRIVLFSEFSGNVRFSFYNKDMKSQYATTIISSTKFLDNSYNNYMTMVNFGSWPIEYISEDYNPTWPEPYGDISPVGITFTQFSNYSSTSVNPSSQQDITPLQGNWNWTWGRQEEDNPYYKRYQNVFTKNETPVVKTIAYADLGLEGVTDRDTLISNYQTLRLHWDGTSITALLRDGEGKKQKYRKTVKTFLGDEYSDITLVAGTYEYEDTTDLIGCGVVRLPIKKASDWPLDYLSLNLRSKGGAAIIPFGVNSNFEKSGFGYEQRMKIKIELLPTELQITGTDLSFIKQYSSNELKAAMEGALPITNTYGWCPAWYSGDDKHIEQFNSKTQMKYIDFIKRS